MHIFDYSFLQDALLPAQLVTLTANIASLRTMTDLRRNDFLSAYSELERIAKIESVKASNAIEGIVTTDARISRIMLEDTAPLNHSEAEIAGYRDCLNLIHSNHSSIDFSESQIINLHSILNRHLDSPPPQGYKSEDNVIAEKMPDGKRVVRFRPASAAETPAAMEQLVLAFRDARDNPNVNKLLLIPCVILDFLCIHPFPDGNGRISRLLTLLLLYRYGFDAGKYVSFEQRINADKLGYYSALRESSAGWESNENRCFPFMIHFLTTLYQCYSELDRRFAAVNSSRPGKMQRIESAVLLSLTPISKADMIRILPDVSPTTIEKVLGDMVKSRRIVKIGTGRNVRYIKN